MMVVGEAGNCREAIETATREQPDVILLDLDLGMDYGLDVLPELFTAVKQARILVLTASRDPIVHHWAVRQGAMGLVVKDKAADVLIKAIEKVYEGEIWLDRALISQVLSELRSDRTDNPDRANIKTLTEREREVVALIGAGLKNKQIAERLFISEATVRHHITSIFDKLGITDRLALAIFAYRYGLARVPDSLPSEHG